MNNEMPWFFRRRMEPKEIVDFLRETFEIYEIRGRVGNVDGISFTVRSNEGNHVVPHVHAQYGEYNVSVEISDEARILAGNLPPKNCRKAQAWVREHQDKLMNDWNHYALSANANMTKSRLDFPEE